ncbi:DUF3102 domain-containing protein [Oscillospiraceae bacterium MB24-C1]|nr:DUF3102 domain-containing protein [Oscillospiraceae bacterium MB24-C1]
MNSTALRIIKNEAVADKRSLNTITAEIVTITRQTQLMILHSAIEVGRRLCEAKEQVAHGGWGEYLKNEVNFSVSTANNFMRVFKEFGDDQMPLFGDAKSQTFGNLTYSQAVALFAVPKDERENFVVENNVEELSVAELKKLIAERDQQLTEAQGQTKTATENLTTLQNEIAALKEKGGEISHEQLKTLQAKAEEEARAKAKAELEQVIATTAEETAKAIEQQKQLEEKLKAAQDTAKVEAEKAIAEEQKKIAELQEQLNKAQSSSKANTQKALDAEKKKVADLEEQLKTAKDSAKAETDKAIAEEKKKLAELQKQLETAKTSAKEEANKVIAEEQKKLTALQEQLKKAEAEDAAAAAELKAAKNRTAELEKKLKLANTDTTVFAVHFEDLQACINKLNGLVIKMAQGEDKETAEKLKAGLKKVLTDAVKKL